MKKNILLNRLKLTKENHQFPFLENNIIYKLAVFLYIILSSISKIFFNYKKNIKVDNLFVVYGSKFFKKNKYYGSYSSYYLYEKTKKYGTNGYFLIPNINNLSIFFKFFLLKKQDIILFFLNPFLNNKNINFNFNQNDNSLLKSNFIKYFLNIYYYNLEKYILSINPKNIFIESSTGYTDNFIIDICNKYNIKIVFVPHGLGEMLYIEKEAKDGFFTPDYYFSPYKESKNIYGNRIYNKNLYKYINIINIGLINWGFLVDKDLKFNDLDFKKSNIYYISQPLLEFNNFTEKEYNYYLSKLSNIKNIICKIHPRDNLNFYKRVFGNKIIDLKPPFYGALVKTGKIFITSCSTMGYEIILSNKALIIYTPKKVKKKIEFFGKYGVKVFTEDTFTNMENFIENLLNDKKLYNNYILNIKKEVEKEGYFLSLDKINFKLEKFFNK